MRKMKVERRINLVAMLEIFLTVKEKHRFGSRRIDSRIPFGQF
jgi:hypothetical protein